MSSFLIFEIIAVVMGFVAVVIDNQVLATIAVAYAILGVGAALSEKVKP
jgi:hypothetical protein